MTMDERTRNGRPYLSLRVKLLLTFMTFHLVVSIVYIVWQTTYTYNQVFDQLSDRLVGTISGAINGMDVENFVLLIQEEMAANPNCPPQPGTEVSGYYPDNNPRYLAHENWLRTVQSFSPETRMYTYIKGPGTGDVIAVGSTGYFRQPRGGLKFCELYNSNGQTQIYQGLSGRVDSWRVYTDRFGSWITTYHPITDADGQVVGAIGVDISASQVQGIRRQIVWNSAARFAIIALIGYIFAYSAAGFLTRPLSQLTQAARAVKAGDYSFQFSELGFRTYEDEIHVLNETFADMSRSIAERSVRLEESNLRLRELALSVIDIQEEERRRVSRELHDQAGQSLIVLQNHLDAALSACACETPIVGERLEQAVSLLGETAAQINNLSHLLHPSLLDVADLNLALEQLCLDFSESTNLQVTFRGCEILPSLPKQVSLTFFRFLQEALTNVAKHANAQNVNVRLDYAGGLLSISVSDDGKGILSLEQKKAGLGHQAMRERLKLLGGALEIEVPQDGGFMIRAVLPWQQDVGQVSPTELQEARDAAVFNKPDSAAV